MQQIVFYTSTYAYVLALVIGIDSGRRTNTDIDSTIAIFRLKIPAGKSRGKGTKDAFSSVVVYCKDNVLKDRVYFEKASFRKF